ncbi:hypothetical protein [Micrococcus luteus]|uniref:hypothetical protein n=1 Tax=Micrococcus luteus TaxID=1270 RepID=UPI0034156B88
MAVSKFGFFGSSHHWEESVALYISLRALRDYLGRNSEATKIIEAEVSKFNSLVEGSLGSLKTSLGKDYSRNTGTERPPADMEVEKWLHEGLRLKRPDRGELIAPGDFIESEVSNWTHGTVPFYTRGAGIFRNHLAVYMGVGGVKFDTGLKAWLRRIFLNWNQTPISLQAFGSADNYASWTEEKMKEKIMSEGWYPSSPEGLVDLFSREYDLTDEFRLVERSKENLDLSKTGNLCEKFEHILGGRFHNSHRPAGSIPKIDGMHSVHPKVRVIGYVDDVRSTTEGVVNAILVRPILVTVSGR